MGRYGRGDNSILDGGIFGDRRILIAIVIIAIVALAAIGLASQAKSGVNNNHTIVIFVSGALAISNPAGNVNILVSFAASCTTLYGKVNTAPTGSSIIFTINKNGVSIGQVTIAAGSTSSSTTITATKLAVNDIITVQITQIGSTVTGSDLSAEAQCTG